MSRISGVMKSPKENGRNAVIPYVVAGDPNVYASLLTMHSLVAAGADIIELGFPFSDPMAEGPIIAQGHERALAAGMSLGGTLALVEAFRREDDRTPIVLMGYLNPVERMGYKDFCERAAAAGVDGVLIVDMPVEESNSLKDLLDAQRIDLIYLVTPATDQSRAEKIISKASGYLYYVSIKGVTGDSDLDYAEISERMLELRSYSDLPLCVGFGIKDATTAKLASKEADGVIIGSVLVNKCALLEGESIEDVSTRVAAVIGDIRQTFS